MAFEKQNLVHAIKHSSGGVMIWGCMAASGVSGLIFIDCTLDHTGYLNALKENLKQSARDLNLRDDFWFQQDNDPKHTAHSAKLWLLYNIKNELNTPPQLPDLNPSEYLRDLLELKIWQHSITSKDMLKSVIIMKWNNISSNEIRRIVQSMPKQLTRGKHKVYPTKYCI